MNYKNGERLTVYCDGACHPYNPGGYACWAWMASSGEQDYGCIGYGDGMTNNVAEYEAVMQALNWAKDNGKKGFIVKTDSKLVVRQSSGKWKVSAEHLKPKVAEVKRLLIATSAKIKWIPREANKKADELSRIAVEKAMVKNKNGRKGTYHTCWNRVDWKNQSVSDRQVHWLNKFGLSCNPEEMTRGEAHQILARLFKTNKEVHNYETNC